MNKITRSLVIVAAVAVVAGLGSFALWSDQETSTGNSITADQMDLVLGNVPVSLSNVAPGDTGTTAAMTLQNDSNTVDGTLTFVINNLVDDDNGCPEAEANEGGDITCGAGEGELSAHVKVGISADLDGDTVYETTLAEQYLNTFGPSQTIGTIAAGDTANVMLTYTVDDSAPFADNIFMTDSSVFDVVFTLTQI